MFQFIFSTLAGLFLLYGSLFNPNSLYDTWRTKPFIKLTGKAGKIIVRSFTFLFGLAFLIAGIAGIVVSTIY